MPKREINPIPEMIKGQKWEVREAEKQDQAYVDLEKRQMVVPLDFSPKSELLRSHELMHVAISPFDKQIEIDSAVEDRTLQSLEDCRVWQELDRVGVNASGVDIAGRERSVLPLIPSMMAMKGANEQEIGLELARLALARRNTGSEGWVRETIEGLGYEQSIKVADQIVEKFFQPYIGEAMPFEPVIEACEYLHEAFSGKVAMESEPESGPGENDEKGEPVEGEESESKSGDGDSEDEDQDKKEQSESDPKASKGGKKKQKSVSISPVTADDKPLQKLPQLSDKERKEARDEAGLSISAGSMAETGTMEIVRPELTLRFKPSRGRKKVNTDMGVNPKSLHRATTDQKIFSEKAVRDYGVAILIDCSGSMSVSQYDIEQILEECPAATIAIYASGVGSSGRRFGILKVIVENKMRIAKDEDMLKGMGGGNVVDVPAVEWLANRREEKKIWVCDGVVTGKNDTYLAAEGVRRITRLVLDRNIKRAWSVEELIEKKRTLLGMR